MTIEIRQLVIRATAEARPAAPLPAPASGERSAVHVGASASPAAPIDHDALVDTCVRRVLRELRRSQER